MEAVDAVDLGWMRAAVAAAAGSRLLSPPNPWVGCVIVATDGRVFRGGTQRPGGPHAEVVALSAAGEAAAGSTVYVTLEPCSHHGRTPPCADALVAAGVARVVVAVLDPDVRVAGAGVERLRAAGLNVDVGVGAAEVEDQLAPYLHHRRTGRPWVVLKLAGTLDGRTAAPDGTSRWITGPRTRLDAHALRAASDAIVVGAGTVRADDPALTVRGVVAPDGDPVREPLRVVLGTAPLGAAAHPCLELRGELGLVLDDLGARDVVQVLVEGGAGVAGAFHRAGLVDHYVLYLAPALFGGDDGVPLFRGAGAPTIASLGRGRIVAIDRIGDDLRIDFLPSQPERRSDEP